MDHRQGLNSRTTLWVANSSGLPLKSAPGSAEGAGVIFLALALKLFLRRLEAGNSRGDLFALLHEAVCLLRHRPSCSWFVPVRIGAGDLGANAERALQECDEAKAVDKAHGVLLLA
jgi:hypothetical protein